MCAFMKGSYEPVSPGRREAVHCFLVSELKGSLNGLEIIPSLDRLLMLSPLVCVHFILSHSVFWKVYMI